jgi:hypothetical protein
MSLCRGYPEIRGPRRWRNHGGNHRHAQEELHQPYQQQEQQLIERWKADQAEAGERIA